MALFTTEQLDYGKCALLLRQCLELALEVEEKIKNDPFKYRHGVFSSAIEDLVEA